MLSVFAIFVTVFLFTLLGMAWVVGVDYVRKHFPDSLVKFYMVMSAIRFVFVLTAMGIYMVFSPGWDSTCHYAILLLALYALMMVVTLIIKH
jgi:hypothetical protein